MHHRLSTTQRVGPVTDAARPCPLLHPSRGDCRDRDRAGLTSSKQHALSQQRLMGYGGLLMALRLVIGACSNEYVANWALQRMDDDLVRRTRREAAYLGKPPGRFVAEIVRDFERTSDF